VREQSQSRHSWRGQSLATVTGAKVVLEWAQGSDCQKAEGPLEVRKTVSEQKYMSSFIDSCIRET